MEPVTPKDLWLAERCLAERRLGRKTLVYLRQTGKRDVQPHVAEVLQAHGLRVGVLSPSIAPRGRVAWIQRQAPQIDVLLTNARLVKVGLNLRMFATAIFFEIEWSLAILWQAMRRVYRPGASLPVRVIFPAYAGTLEERALSLIGQKMKAASLFYGDEVASALTEEDESDFLNDLVRSVLKKEQFSRVESIFATENDLSASPLGSPNCHQPAGIGRDDPAGVAGAERDQPDEWWQTKTCPRSGWTDSIAVLMKRPRFRPGSFSLVMARMND